jgi:ABC-2 type transport system ATP-binding protein
VAEDMPEALKASVGTDRVRIETGDDDAAVEVLRDRFGLDAIRRDGAVMFSVPDGEHFVPILFSELTVPIRSVQVTRPTLDDVFLAYTGRTIRDTEAGTNDSNRMMAAAFRR